MGAELGRISGPLLANNLYRHGTDLAFETSLLYLAVNGQQIGIKTNSTVSDLTVNGTTNTTTLQVPQFTNISSGFSISTNYIQNLSGSITFHPNQSNNPTINVVGLLGTEGVTTANLLVNNNSISATTSNTDINLSPSGLGQVVINSDTLINGDLHATGNITWDGNVTLGSSTGNTVNFQAELNSDILPSSDNLFTLGSPSLRWNNAYTQTLNPTTFNSTNLSSATLNAGNIQFNGNTITNTSPGQPINLTPNGFANVSFNGVNWIVGNAIQNYTNTALTLSNTGYGYVKFAGTYGVVIPLGNTGQRPANPENGTFRYNTETGIAEIYSTDSNSWIAVEGANPPLTTSQFDDVISDWALIFNL